MATQIKVPALGESITQAILVKWHKADGDSVAVDEPVCELETDKANVDLPSPAAGVVHRLKEEGDTVDVGEAIATVEEATTAFKGAPPTQPPAAPPADAPAAQPPASAAAPKTADLSPAVRRLVEEKNLNPADITATGPGGRLTKGDVLQYLENRDNGKKAAAAAAPAPPPAPARAPSPPVVPAAATLPKIPATDFDASGVRRVSMSKIRKRIAERLVEAQRTAAILTTFNEVDMSAVMDLRARFKERFTETHGAPLGLMSFFVRGAVLALREFPRLNAFIEGDDIVYHQGVNMGIAVSTDRGLAVPVLRDVQNMSFGRIEAEIKRVATAVREGKLGLEELSGGTFTITNGGVFGSLLSTPIINPPQSGILGLHAIQKRPMVVNDKIEIRPMMYIALSYDHRLVDGRESVSFLVRLKQYVEDPTRLMLEI